MHCNSVGGKILSKFYIQKNIAFKNENKIRLFIQETYFARNVEESFTVCGKMKLGSTQRKKHSDECVYKYELYFPNLQCYF